MKTTVKKVLMAVLAVIAVVTVSFAGIQKERKATMIELLETRTLDAIASAYTGCQTY